MSSALADLIQQPAELVENALRKIEDLNGNPSQDARVLAENIQKLRFKTQELGLDPDDTTGEELYQALRAKLAADSAQLNKALGVTAATPLNARITKAIGLVSQANVLPETWVLKQQAVKKLLAQQPPLKLMKSLNYRSMTSFIKHENICQSYLLAGLSESRTWQSKMAKAAAKLASSDYEMRRLSIAALDQKYGQSLNSSQAVIGNQQIGIIALNPAGLPQDAEVLSLAVLLLGQAEEISGRQLISRLGELNPSLRWWPDNQGLILRCEDGPVSLNIKDLARDQLLGRAYGGRSTNHAKQTLLDRLAERYENQSAKVSEAFETLGYKLAGSDISPAAKQGLVLEYAEAE